MAACLNYPACAKVGSPYPDQRFDLILNRHESFDAFEVVRVLRPGGVFLSQQVGGRDLAELNQQLAAPPHTYTDWTLNRRDAVGRASA